MTRETLNKINELVDEAENIKQALELGLGNTHISGCWRGNKYHNDFNFNLTVPWEDIKPFLQERYDSCVQELIDLGYEEEAEE